MKLQFVSVHSKEKFLQLQAEGQLNPQLSYEEYLEGCQETNEFIKRQREAMDPFDRAILEEREADFHARRKKRPLAA